MSGLGQENTANFDSLVAAGMMTRKEANAKIKKLKERKKRSLLKK